MTRARSPISPSRPVFTGKRRARIAARMTAMRDQPDASDDDQDHQRIERRGGRARPVSKKISAPTARLISAPTVSIPCVGARTSMASSTMASSISASPAQFGPMAARREQEEQQRDAADGPRHDGAWVRELQVDADRRDDEEQEEHIRVEEQRLRLVGERRLQLGPAAAPPCARRALCLFASVTVVAVDAGASRSSSGRST